MAFHLLNLPHEVLHSIFTLVNPTDIASLHCCRFLRDFLRADKLLYRAVYLGYLDDPRVANDPEAEIRWEEKLHELVRIGKILDSHDQDLQLRNIDSVASAIHYLLTTAQKDPVSEIGSKSSKSRNLVWLDRHLNQELPKRCLLSRSTFYSWAATHLWQDANAATECYMPNCDHSHANKAPNSPSRETSSQQEPSSDLNAEDTLPKTAKPDDHLAQLSAKLHCLYGIPIQQVHRGFTANLTRYHLRSDSAPVHAYARSRVYDLRQHTTASYWGPFKDDGTRDVDWEKLEAIMLNLDHNMRQLCSVRDFSDGSLPKWDVPFEGAAPYSYIARPAPFPVEPAIPLQARDPYNITGTWNRIVCFLDYTELFDFNFSTQPPPARQPRPPLDTDEAIRLIATKLYITKVEQPGPEDGQALPVVWFKGTSSSVRPSWDPNANSTIRGCVRLTREGEVHWTSWSIFRGEERWRSEGIQLGGVQSGRGVLGYWFDKDYDAHGPAGPTAFWKTHDGIQKKESGGRMSAHELFAMHMPMY